MVQLNDGYADDVRSMFGDRLGAAVAVQAPQERGYLSELADAFRVTGQPASIAVSATEPVIDFGGRIANESSVAVPLRDPAKTGVAKMVGQLAGFAPGPDSSALLFARRALDAGVSGISSLGVADFSGVMYVAVSADRKQIGLYVVDGDGVRPLQDSFKTSTPDAAKRYFQRRTELRANRFDADTGGVYRTRRGRFERVSIKAEVDRQVPYDVTDGTLVATRTRRILLGRDVTVVAAPPAATTSNHGPALTRGDSDYGVVRSALTDSGAAPSGGSIQWTVVTGDTAPAGLIWGDPGSTLNCSRISHDGCRNCCQAITNRYAGAAATVFAGGVGTSIGAVAGVITIPVAWVPAAVGAGIAGVIGIVGFIHSSSCESGCRQLYDNASGRSVMFRTYNLESVQRSEVDESQDVFRGTVEIEGVKQAFSADRLTLMSLVWGGGQVEIDLAGLGNPARLALARRPGSDGYYLRTYRDKTRQNNLANLPRGSL